MTTEAVLSESSTIRCVERDVKTRMPSPASASVPMFGAVQSPVSAGQFGKVTLLLVFVQSVGSPDFDHHTLRMFFWPIHRRFLHTARNSPFGTEAPMSTTVVPS